LVIKLKFYENFYKIGKWFAPNAVRPSHVFRGNKNTNQPIFYFCLTNTTGITSKSKHTVKYPRS